MPNDVKQHYRIAFEAAYRELLETKRIASLHDWSVRAKLTESAIRNFLEGRSESLSIVTYHKLATAAGTTIGYLLGEGAPRSEKARLILEAYEAAPEQGKALLEAHAQRELQLARSSGE